MPVDNKHIDYMRAAPGWEEIRTVVEGEASVKNAGTALLPMLGGQSDMDYAAYKKRAMFYDAASRTVEALVGMIMRKPPTVVFSTTHADDLELIGRRNESLEELLTKACDEIVTVARIGHLVDAPSETAVTASAQSQPFIVTYPAESIYNWEEGVINGVKQPVKIVLRETRSVADPEDPEFGYIEETFFRVLKMAGPEALFDPSEFEGTEVRQEVVDAANDFVENGPFYVQEIWEKVDNPGEEDEEEWALDQTIVPKMAGGRLLRSIPFTLTNSRDTSFEVTKSPIGSLVSVNLSHYRNSADLEHGRHLTALPTPWAVGFDAKTLLRIGSAAAWTTENENAKFGYLEFTGKGLGHLQEGMEHKEKLMATLAARVLESAPAGVEAAETVKLRHSGEQSALARVSSSVSDAFTTLIRWVGDWMGLAGFEDFSVQLNKDFNLMGIPPALLKELFAGVQLGQLSWNSLFWNMKKGELIPDDIDMEEEAELIAAGPPEMPAPVQEETTPPDEGIEEKEEEEEEETEAA